MQQSFGSQWWSFDFHNHTPASSDYNGGERETLTPRSWLLAYMGAGIDCVAVTDHNCGDWIDRLKAEYSVMSAEDPQPAGFRPLHLFPGVELTSAEGLHIIGLYGPADTAAKIHAIKALSGCKDQPNNAESMCTESSVTICERIRSSNGLAILAHAEKVNGIFEGEVDSNSGAFRPHRGDREIEQILEKCDAIEVHDISRPAMKHFIKKTEGRALINGSDAHRTSKAGTRYVWVKMEEPSIEGLRLAFLDPESSLLRPDGTVASAPPAAPSYRIVTLNVSQLRLRRSRPLEVTFSPWFNSVIGGRGSGKSTLLETLRLGLSREDELLEFGDSSDVFKAFQRFKKMGAGRGDTGMLNEQTKISVVVEKTDSGVATLYRYSWTPKGISVEHRDEQGEWSPTYVNAAQAAALFPVKIYSQKQVFEIADRPSALLKHIDSALEVRFDEWTQEHEELKSALRQLRSKERALKLSIARKPPLDAELKEVSKKATAYQQSNISSQVAVFQECQASKKSITDFVKAAGASVQVLETTVDTEGLFEGPTLPALSPIHAGEVGVLDAAAVLKKQLSNRFANIKTLVQEMRADVAAFEEMQSIVEFLKTIESSLSAYRAEALKLQAEGITTAKQAEEALARKQEIEKELEDIAAQEKELVALHFSIKRAFAALSWHRRRLTKRRQNFVNRVLKDVHDLRIFIDGQSDVDATCPGFRRILRLQEGVFVDDILCGENQDGNVGLLDRVVGQDGYTPTHKRVSMLKHGLIEGHKTILGKNLHGRLQTALGKLSPDDYDKLLEWFPLDKVRVEYRRTARDSFESLEKASAGQKTSAILSFLLADGDEPLVLDQPEDDLDNALVYSLVVKQIRANKSRRQIIIVTHNPNIVVNGDAELVLPMIFNRGEIHLVDAGGLQQRAVRERICELMEGGKDAFRQRYKRILEDMEATA